MVPSRNAEWEPTGGHVFSASGSPYSVCLQVTNASGTTSADCKTVTVSSFAADSTTVCVSPTSNFTGCPGGAGTSTTSSFNTALGLINGSTVKRILLHRGETWTVSGAATNAANGAAMVGAYGTGAQPIVSGSPAIVVGNDWRFVDLDFECGGSGSTQVFNQPGTKSNLLLYQLKVNGCSQLIQSDLSPGGMSDLFLVDSSFTAAGTAAELWFNADGGILLGNDLNMNGSGYHNIRTMCTHKAIWAHNYMHGDSSASFENLTVRGDTGNTCTTQYVVVEDNKIDTTGSYSIVIKAGLDDYRISDTIVERNWTINHGSSTFGGPASVSNTSVRNNFADMSASTAWESIGCGSNDASVPTDGVWFYNNTEYRSVANTSNQFSIDGNCTNVIIKNTLAFAPNCTSCSINAGGATASNNSTVAQMKIDPKFTCPSGCASSGAFTPTSAKPTTGSYAIGGGTSVPVWFDAFGMAETGDIGARMH